MTKEQENCPLPHKIIITDAFNWKVELPDNIVGDGGCSEGCCDDYKCTACGYTFRVEAPQ